MNYKFFYLSTINITIDKIVNKNNLFNNKSNSTDMETID
jgi:hypothetical protein